MKTNRMVARAVLAVACAVFVTLSGCGRAQEPFKMVQLCVNNMEGLEQLRAELQSIAASEHLQFQDASQHTEAELKAMKYPGNERTLGSPVVNIQMGRQDGLGVGVGNLGLPGYQLALGFTAGSNEAEARSFASKVIADLEKRWSVHMVPDGKGALPMEGCQ